MKYVGSKARFAKELVPIIQNYIDKSNAQMYIEPFVGGANVIDKITCDKKIGLDTHKQLIALFKELQNGYIPPKTITEREYNEVRVNRDKYPDYYIGLVGFCSTFGSKYFGGYARGFKEDKVTPRDIPSEGIANLMKQIPNLKGIKFYNRSYLELPPEKINNAVIYCDPPYQNTTKYATNGLNYDDFWNWAIQASKNNMVLVSEYEAPSGFECIWQKNTTTSLKVKEHENRVEKLFIYKGERK